MKFLFVLLFVVASQQLCYGATRMRSFGSLNRRTRLMHSFKGLPDFADLANNEKRKVYSYEQTLVVRVAGLTDRVHHCQVIEVYKEDEAAKVRKELELQLRVRVEVVDMKRMMSLLADCDSVDGWDADEEPDKETSEKPNSHIFFTNGIFPGTKWCGVGDIANGYHDLGELHYVDRCCRAHDLCPIKILSRDTRYNLTNKSYYIKSHCLCDKAFYDCLKEDDGWPAKFLGNLYFYAASSQCIEGVPEDSGEKMKFVPTLNKL